MIHVPSKPNPEMSKTPKQLPDGVDGVELKKLEAKHGPLKTITVNRDGKPVVGLFKKPTLAILGAANATSKDEFAMGQFLYENCKVKVDPEMDEDDEVKLAAIRGVGQLFRLLEVVVGEASA